MSKRQQKRREARRRAAGDTVTVTTNRVRPGHVVPCRPVPAGIVRPPYVRAPGSPEPSFPAGTFVDRMRAAGAAAAEVLRVVGEQVAVGVTTEELDALALDTYVALGGYPSTVGYRGYQKSICTSVNEVICHGIPDDRPLADGDIVNCDITIYLDGVHGDTSTTFLVGEVDPEVQRLVTVTRQCMWRGIDAVRPGAPVNAIGRAIQEHAEANGFSVVRMFVGHGIGTEFHTAPSVAHYYDRTASDLLLPGTTFTIEPMINLGTWEVGRIWRDGWTAPTADGLPSAQFEHTVLVTDDGVEVLTLGRDEVPDHG